MVRDWLHVMRELAGEGGMAILFVEQRSRLRFRSRQLLRRLVDG
jgi:hypothetical protein